MFFKGIDIDENSRCRHYHTEQDIVALKCADCQPYYACYKCHDVLEDHTFKATSSDEPYPVICGACQSYLTFSAYKRGSCPQCDAVFNPNCQLHDHIYFSKEFHHEQH
ncbi:CHY zinc finger protein [Streptococcus pluranimalium]